MNKNLETEYKDLMEQEMSSIDADALWNRIEAALPEKGVDGTSETTGNNVVKLTPKKWYKNNKIIPISGTIAACAVALIIVYNTTGGFNKALTQNNSATSTVEYSEAATMTDSVAKEEAENTVDAFIEAEMPVEAWETMPEDVICIDFEIMDENEDYYICVTLCENDLMPEDTEFFLIKDEDIEVGNKYSCYLVLTDETEGKYIFEVLY